MNETSYRIAFSMYVALGGDPNATFESVDAVYDEIHKLLGVGGAENVETLKVDITQIGEYNYTPDNGIGYNPVLINVDIDTKSYYDDGYNDGYNTGSNEGYTNGFTQGESEGYNNGYGEGKKDGAEDQKALLETITISENGTYTKEDGYKEVIVEVAGSGGNEFDFTEIGYDTEYNDTVNNFIYENTLNDIEISKNFMNEVNELMESGNSVSTNLFYIKLDYEYTLAYAPMLNYTKLNRQYGVTSIFSLLNQLIYVPQIDTSTWTNMEELFGGCTILPTIPQLDTSNVEVVDSMFNGCLELITLPMLDFSNVRSLHNMLLNSTNLTNIGGFKNLGMNSSLKDNLDLSQCKKLTYESIMNVINNLYDRASAGMSVLTVIFPEYGFSLLSDEDKAIATNKGWMITL